MVFVSSQQLKKTAQAQGMEKIPKSEQPPPMPRRRIGAVKMPSVKLSQLPQSGHEMGPMKYKEYRTGVMKGAVHALGNFALSNEDQKNKFINSVANSTDMISLIHQCSLINTLDEIGGSVKLAMTVAGKVFEAKLS